MSTLQKEFDEISIDSIETPNRSEKLHPFENEKERGDEDDEENKDETKWDDFLESVGTEPNHPPTVRPNGEGYELVDGDRRLRALKENGAEEVYCQIRHDIENKRDLYAERLESNEYRLDNDSKARSRYIAQICAPWIMPPGERVIDFEDTLNQTELAEKIGTVQSTISKWLGPARNRNPLRAALSDKVSKRADEEDMERIDRIVALLTQRGEYDNLVVLSNQNQFAANEISLMEGVSLAKIENTAEKAATRGWDCDQFLKYLEGNFAHDEQVKQVEEEVDAGMMDGSPDPFEDDSETGGVSVEDVEVDEEKDQEDEPETQFEAPEMEVDWEVLVDESQLNEKRFSELKSNKMISTNLQDEAAIMFNVICEVTGHSPTEVMRQFVEPHIVQAGAAYLRDI